MRGTASIAKDVTPASARPLATSPLVSGWRKAISAEPRCRRPISSALGGCTLATTSPEKPAPASSFAPASSNAESRTWDASPAPGSTTTSVPPAVSFLTTSGTIATRVSPAADSLGTETFIGAAEA